MSSGKKYTMIQAVLLLDSNALRRCRPASQLLVAKKVTNNCRGRWLRRDSVHGKPMSQRRAIVQRTPPSPLSCDAVEP
jgi:hypothetical protein